MAKRMVVVPTSAGPLDLDLVSHGRAGPQAGPTLSPEQIQQVQRTVRRTPEVVVKVSGGGRDTGGVQAHFAYIGRHGKQAIVTDDGRELMGKGAAAELVAVWSLELSPGQYRAKPAPGQPDKRPKIAHHVVLSMPGQTAPALVLQAAQKFARENFALQHRYAMVLHTDQKHPHVHLVVKAHHQYEPGKRLHIKKETLRRWRAQFAACLRELGVPANATPSALRGRAKTATKDAIHHRLREAPAESTFMRAKAEAVSKAVQSGSFVAEPGKAKLIDTRQRSCRAGRRSPRRCVDKARWTWRARSPTSWRRCLACRPSANGLPVRCLSGFKHSGRANAISNASVEHASQPGKLEGVEAVCLVDPRYHAVLALKVCALAGRALAACGRLRTLTAALRRGEPVPGNPARTDRSSS